MEDLTPPKVEDIPANVYRDFYKGIPPLDHRKPGTWTFVTPCRQGYHLEQERDDKTFSQFFQWPSTVHFNEASGAIMLRTAA